MKKPVAWLATRVNDKFIPSKPMEDEGIEWDSDDEKSYVEND